MNTRTAAAMLMMSMSFVWGAPHGHAAPPTRVDAVRGQAPHGGVGSESPRPKSTAEPRWSFSPYAQVEFMVSEVTVAQWNRCVEAGRCTVALARSRTAFRSCNLGVSERLDHPLNCVEFRGAQQVCAFLGGRVPTGKEWLAEATRGGSSPWPWGTSPPSPERARYVVSLASGVEDVHATTQPVCAAPAGRSASGVCDLIGNVNEWTTEVPTVIADQRPFRVVRGASAWDYELATLLPGHVLPVVETHSPHGVGVRCVRDRARSPSR